MNEAFGSHQNTIFSNVDLLWCHQQRKCVKFVCLAFGEPFCLWYIYLADSCLKFSFVLVITTCCWTNIWTSTCDWSQTVEFPQVLGCLLGSAVMERRKIWLPPFVTQPLKRPLVGTFVISSMVIFLVCLGNSQSQACRVKQSLWVLI